MLLSILPIIGVHLVFLSTLIFSLSGKPLHHALRVSATITNVYVKKLCLFITFTRIYLRNRIGDRWHDDRMHVYRVYRAAAGIDYLLVKYSCASAVLLITLDINIRARECVKCAYCVRRWRPVSLWRKSRNYSKRSCFAAPSKTPNYIIRKFNALLMCKTSLFFFRPACCVKREFLININ